VEALERAVAMGYSWGGFKEYICNYAARYGHLNVLKWAREEHDCPWGPIMYVDAAMYGHLEILKYLRSAGCPWGNKALCADLARIRHGANSEINRWIMEQPQEVALAANDEVGIPECMLCPICCESAIDHVIVRCGHCFCGECLTQQVILHRHRCACCEVPFWLKVWLCEGEGEGESESPR